MRIGRPARLWCVEQVPKLPCSLGALLKCSPLLLCIWCKSLECWTDELNTKSTKINIFGPTATVATCPMVSLYKCCCGPHTNLFKHHNFPPSKILSILYVQYWTIFKLNSLIRWFHEKGIRTRYAIDNIYNICTILYLITWKVPEILVIHYIIL